VTVNCLAAEDAPTLVSALTVTGHCAADIGEVLDSPTTITIVQPGSFMKVRADEHTRGSTELAEVGLSRSFMNSPG
jgi:hypothetical protein